MNCPILYDRLQNKIAALNDAYSVKVTQRLQQEWTIEFYHPLDATEKWTLIQTECLVEVEGQKYVLKVVEPDDSNGGVIIHCQGEHVSTQALDEYIDPADDTTLGRTSFLLGVTAQTALQNALLGTRFTVGTVTVTSVLTTSTADAAQGATSITVQSFAGLNPNDVIQIGSTQAVISPNGITGNTIAFSPGLFELMPSGTPVGKNIHDLDMQERNLQDVLREMETSWNGELQFDNWTVNFVAQIGQSNGMAFRYRKNNQQIKRTEDSRNLCTRLYGYGSGGLTIESINSGVKYLDAANINSFSHPIKLKKDYSNIADPESLYQAMKADLADLSQPKVSYQLSIVELAKVAGYPYPTLETFGLGDYVTVIDERLNDLSIVSRVTEYERYPYESMQLSTVQIQSLIDTTYDQMKNVHGNVTGLLKTVNISPRRNGRPIGTVGNPGQGSSISSTLNTDGSANITIAWSFTEDSTSPIDGFGILVHSGTSNTTYVFPSTINADANHLVDKTVRGFNIYGVAADKWYTVAVYPYRLVDQDINSSGVVKGGFEYVNTGNAYQPATAVNFTGNVYGVPGDSINKTPVTFIVADGSTTHSTKRADYVVPANATNADVTINQAISALPSSGGKIVLLDGTYQISNSINLISNLSIEGQGKSTIIKASASLSNMIYGSNVQSVNIKSMLLEGNAKNAQVGVKLSGATSSIVDGIVVQNCATTGIYATSVSGVNIVNSIAQSIGGDGISIENASKCTVANNQSLNNTNSGITLTLTSGQQSIGNTITGNTCSGNQGNSINIASNANAHNVLSNSITGNSITGSYNGIVTVWSDYNTISGNSVSNCSHGGVYIYQSNNNNVAANTMQNSGNFGIGIIGSNNNMVSNNTAIASNQNNSSDSNIEVSNSSYNNLQGNVCRKGSLTYSPVYGIAITDSASTGNIVTNNDLYQSGASGSLSDAGTGTITASGNRVA